MQKIVKFTLENPNEKKIRKIPYFWWEKKRKRKRNFVGKRKKSLPVCSLPPARAESSSS
jgi:hypothetical protein